MKRSSLLLACGLAAVLLGAACSTGSETSVGSLVVDGDVVRLEGSEPLRGLQLDLTWDESLTVKEILPGDDVDRFDLFRSRVGADGHSARVVLTDTRKLMLPARGIVVRLEIEGTGVVRVVDALGADAEAQAVAIEVH